MRPDLNLLLVALIFVACGGSGTGGTGTRSSGSQVPDRPRSFRVDETRVEVEGRWHPIEETPETPAVANSVRVVCVRDDRLCREELTTAREGAQPHQEGLDYRIREWTKARLVAARRQGSTEVILRISLTGMAAEKISDSKADPGRRWRLE